MPVNSGNLYNSLSLSRYMLRSLPAEPTPQLKTPSDAVALLCHASMLAVGFRLVGIGEDHKLEASSEAEDTQPLPREWNATSSYNYAFRYAHTQSSLQYLIKISRLGSKAVINGLGLGDEKVYTLDFSIKDFLSESFFPFTLPSGDDPNGKIDSLQGIFLSAGRLTDLATQFKVQIIQRLAPALHKGGYEETSPQQEPSRQQPHPSSGRESHSQSEPRDPLRSDRISPPVQPHPFIDPLAAAPRRPFPAGDFPPPGFDDEYDLTRPPVRNPFDGNRRPLNIGEQDLYPPGLGPRDPLRGGGYGPGSGMGGGGMHPTFDDPLFGGRGGDAGVYDGRAPPGARYDPVGPGDGPPNLRGPRFPGGMEGRPPNPFGGFGGNDFI